MKRLTFLSLILSTSVFAQQPPVQTLPPLPPAPDFSKLAPPPVQVQGLELQQLSLKTLLNMIFVEYKVNYVMDPALNTDDRSVSLRWNAKKQKLDSFLPDFLDVLGYEMTKKADVYYITKKTNQNINLIKQVYLPKNRTAAYLTDQLAPFFPNNFPTRRPVQQVGDVKSSNSPPGSAAALVDQYSEVLLFQGTLNEWTQVSKLLKQIDTAERNVKISARLYEVNVGSKDGSSFSMLLTLGKGLINVGVGSATAVGNFIQLKNSVINGVFQLIDQDTKFKLINSPFLVVKDGKQAKFESGQDVPTLGTIVNNGNGQSQQSIDYKSTGVIFTVQPKIRRDSIDLQVSQTLSDVVTTTTGLAQTPTIPKRTISTQVVIEPGETIVIGGLRTQKTVKNDQGIWIFRDKSNEVQQTEILLFLTVEKGLTNEEEDGTLKESIN
jgi:general secretion pathway protein D